MTTFDKREEGFEKKFAHDEELQFKAMARRNKLLGLWAAEKLGKTGADAEAYAKEVVLADFEEAGDNDVLRKVAADLKPKGIDEAAIRAQMGALLAQIEPDGPAAKAGLLPGDVVIRLDGVEINGVDDLIRVLDRDRIGRRLAMNVLRLGRLRAIDIDPIERKPAR